MKSLMRVHECRGDLPEWREGSGGSGVVLCLHDLPSVLLLPALPLHLLADAAGVQQRVELQAGVTVHLANAE